MLSVGVEGQGFEVSGLAFGFQGLGLRIKGSVITLWSRLGCLPTIVTKYVRIVRKIRDLVQYGPKNVLYRILRMY